MKTLFVGDVSPTKRNAELFAAGDIATLFGDTLSLFAGNDINMINLECALTDADTAIKKCGPNLKAPRGTANVLKEIGVTVCGISNNHVFDFGKKGVEDTLEALSEVGLLYTGYGKDAEDAKRTLVIEKDGERICLIAVCEHEYSYALENRVGCHGFDPFETPLLVREAKKECDRVVVLYHGGKEMCQYPSPRLRAACHAMAKSGADLILTQHSHCIGCYEQFEGCHILYGQGNFNFVKGENEIIEEIWNSELAVRYDSKTHEIEFVPTVEDGAGITLAKGEEKEALLAAFNARNKQLQDGTWMQGWIDFCESKRETYTNAVVRVGAVGEPKHFERFAHYLDCEAHLDVWMQLFQTDNHRNEL
ncbi:MAG: CapA family protein [Clostridia bacterium]|nr:CapA family protein [Clostridia bacterium]